MPSNKRLEITDEEVKRRFEGAFRVTERIPANCDTPCWNWQRKPDKDGYGLFRFNSVLYRAHRFSHMLYRGEIAPGMDIDHLCENRACVNPDHLEVVTHEENLRRQRSGHNKPLANIPPWELRDDNGRPLRGPTNGDEVLEWCVEMLEEYGTPSEALAIGALADGPADERAPWRPFMDDFERGLMNKESKYAVAALFLYAVAMGTKPKVASLHLLKTSPVTVHLWNRNPEWKTDIETARRAGRTVQKHDTQEGWWERAERDMDIMPFREFVQIGRVFEQRASNARARRERKDDDQKQLPGANVNIYINGNPSFGLLRDLTDLVSPTNVTETQFTPALPPPTDASWRDPDDPDEDAARGEDDDDGEP